MDLKENLSKYLDQETIDKLFKSLENEPSHCLLINEEKTNYEKLKKYFSSLNPHSFIKNAYYFDANIDQPGKSFLFDNGAYYIIDASSLLVSYFLPLNDNDLVLDMCAAPGGKSISCSLKNRKIIEICNDLSKNRAKLMSLNVENLGLSNMVITSTDLDTVYQNYLNTFDKIILDAPCSGSGMFRKNELMKNDWSIDKVLSLTKTQSNLLDIGFKMLKDSGILSYSTCSFSYEENEEIILNFLKNNPDAELINLPHIDGEYRTSQLKEAIHLFPHLYNGEGFFICLIKKHCKSTLFSSARTNKASQKKKFSTMFNLDFKYEEQITNEVFLYNHPLDLSKFYIIKKGLLLCEIKEKTIVPSFHLAHYLSPTNSIELNEKQKDLYISGQTFIYDKKIENGFHVVSYDGINLGYVKSVNNTFKNYYPKGLRH
ncbi:MAG: hypothetical protein IJ656_00850 [Bacilli bacterium]|nr:hypothetical protein [Bacilli bacterium]